MRLSYLLESPPIKIAIPANKHMRAKMRGMKAS